MGATFSLPNNITNGTTGDADEVMSNFNTMINNFTPAGMDDYSSTAAEMDTTSDPYPGSVQTQATSLAGELGQLRHQIAGITGEAKWYIDADTTVPRLVTTAQRDALTPGNGQIVYNSTLSRLQYYNGSWLNVVSENTTDTLLNKTLTTPTIGDFTNATHDHSNAANGGTAVVPSGGQVQVVNVQDGVYNGPLNTAFPVDNTTPQNTEGDELMTLAITPTNASNKLKIDVVVNYDLAGTAKGGLALFQDSTANALAACGISSGAAVNAMQTAKFTHYMTAGTTSATTFKVRGGGGGTNFLFNGIDGTGAVFNGLAASSITITEIKV